MRNRKTEVQKGQGPYRHENHKKPVTRRDFLAAGLTSGLGIAIGPSLLGLLGGSTDAYADATSCGGGSVAAGSGMIPFICFDLAGGANIAGSNVLVGTNGQTDFLDVAGYTKLGVASATLPTDPSFIDTTMGLAFHSGSQLLQGIKNKASPSTLASTEGCVICARSNDDTSNNPHNPMYGIAKAGSKGQLVTLIGTSNTVSGGNSVAPPNEIDSTLRPTKVATAADTSALVDAGKLSTLVGGPDAVKVLDSITRLSAQKSGKLTDADAVKSILGCAYSGSSEKVKQFSDPTVLSPLNELKITTPQNGNANAIFTAAELAAGDAIKTAAIMKLVVQGYAGAGTVQLGGFDYHSGNRSDGDAKDLAAGEKIGAALEFAAVMGQPLMIYVFTDGGVSSNGNVDTVQNKGRLVWTSDNGTCGATFFLVYSPKGKPSLSGTAPATRQLGKYKSTGSVDTAAQPFSNNVNQLAETVVLNYLALHGQTGKFGQVLPAQGLGPSSTWDKYAMFAPIV